jgi:thioredoxin 1
MMTFTNNRNIINHNMMESNNMDSAPQVKRADLDLLKGAAVVEFGASWCGYCQAAQPDIAAALIKYPNVHHIKIEDGRGQRLGRTYAVKLWPTLIFLKDGIEISRLVRPADTASITIVLDALTS